MKKLSFLMTISVLLGLLAFTTIRGGGIQGKITPVEGASQIVAVSGKDTLRTDVNQGSFMFMNVKKGTYMLLVKAKSPYKDALVEHVAVIDSAITDVGEIKLQQ